ncbi:hypothetical protein IGI37_000786 [Enterococcus sp. AZ194]
MLDHLHFKPYRHQFQEDFYKLRCLFNMLYQEYCPASIMDRRNVNQAKISDVACLALSLLTNNVRRFFSKKICFSYSTALSTTMPN